MPPSTMSSTSNVILFPGRRFGPSDRKPRRIGAARLLRHDRQLGVHQLPPGRAKLTKPCHVFRATVITAYLEAGATLETAQAVAAHESPRATKLYDRTGDDIALDEVERSRI